MRTGRRRAKTSRRSRRRQNIKICCSAATRCTHKRRAGKSRSLSLSSVDRLSVRPAVSVPLCLSVRLRLSFCLLLRCPLSLSNNNCVFFAPSVVSKEPRQRSRRRSSSSSSKKSFCGQTNNLVSRKQRKDKAKQRIST